MKKGELVQVDFVVPATGDSVHGVAAVGFVAILTNAYVTLSQTAATDDGQDPNLISIPVGAITFSRLLEPGRKRSALPRQAAKKSTAAAKS